MSTPRLDPDVAFLRARTAIDAYDLDALGAVLDACPEVVAATGGPNANDLLGMATATCDERLVDLLLTRGADVAAANVHGWTPLHQAAYRGHVPLVGRLRAAGAPTDGSARGDGGTPLIVALFWGHRDAAEALADPTPEPPNLRAAAGLGATELLERLTVGAPDALPPAAGAHRAFFRPHSGFPAGWQPSDDPQEVLDEALSWAARSGRDDAARRLVGLGAAADADVYRGTALAWAAATGRPATVRTLVELGAHVDARTTFGGPDHGDRATALHLAAGDGALDTVRTLLELGADPTIRDARHDADPAGWADHAGHAEVVAVLRRRSRGSRSRRPGRH